VGKELSNFQRRHIRLKTEMLVGPKSIKAVRLSFLWSGDQKKRKKMSGETKPVV
jgi:hypothetical protein